MDNDIPERDNDEIGTGFDQTNGKVAGLEGHSNDAESDEAENGDESLVERAESVIDNALPFVRHDAGGTTAEDRDEAVTPFSEERDR